MAYRLPNDVHKQLIDQGIVPPDCREVALVFPASGVVSLRYEVFATIETMEKLAAIIAAFVEKEKSLA